MTRKRLLALLCSVFLTLILVAIPLMAGCDGAEGEAEEEEEVDEKAGLPVIHVLSAAETPATASTNIIFKEWMERWDEATPNYRIEVEYHYGAEIFPGAEGAEAMARGDLDIGGSGTTYYLAGFVPEIGLFDIPILWKSKRHVVRFLEEVPAGQEIIAKLDAKGLYVYEVSGYEMWPMFLEDIEVTRMEQLQGMKFRTMQSPTMVRALELLGANPVVVPTAELTFAMSTHMFTGMIASLSPPYITYLGYLDYGKTILAFPISMTCSISACSAQWYNDLPDEVKQSFQETQEWHREASWTRTLQDQGWGKEMMADVLTVTRLTQDEADRWESALTPLYDWAAEQWGREYIDAALASG